MKNEKQGPQRPSNTVVGRIQNGFLARMMHYTSPAVKVWLALANRADCSGISFPSIKTLQADTGLARATVERSINELERAGELIVARGKGIGSKYTFGGGSGIEPVQEMNRSSSGIEPEPVQHLNSNHKDITKRNNKKRGAAAEVSVPSELDTEQFKAAWGEWLAYRRERRLTCTPRTLNAQLRKLATWGPATALDAIETAIRAGWQGLFEPKSNGRDTSTAKSPEKIRYVN